MSRTPSTMLALGTVAPTFSLTEPASGKTIALDDLRGEPGLLVVFWSNHCPYVKHIQRHFTDLARRYQERGLSIVAINANDVAGYPDDSPEKMAEAVGALGFTFPYLFDETQETAKVYRAACTPDFFLFDGERRLVYRGQYDDARPGNDIPVSGRDLAAAIDALLDEVPISADQRPSLGCNIKWRAGNEPDYFGQPTA